MLLLSFVLLLTGEMTPAVQYCRDYPAVFTNILVSLFFFWECVFVCVRLCSFVFVCSFVVVCVRFVCIFFLFWFFVG